MRRVAEAQAEINRLRRQLAALEREGLANREIDRSSSAKRILVERVILRRIERQIGRPTTSDELWPYVAAAGVTNRSTFRSIMHRMSLKGLVQSPSAGNWMLGEKANAAELRDPALDAAMAQIERNFRRATLSQSR